jgi:alpha-1,2-mannosyltransferase
VDWICYYERVRRAMPCAVLWTWDVLSRTAGSGLTYDGARMAGESFSSRLAVGLTERRLRVHGLILAVCLWSAYAVDLTHPGLLDRFGLTKGTDFVHFYTLGTLALQGHASELYNSGVQATLAAQLMPGVPILYYVALYGPQVSLFFAPFAKLPYAWALALWWLFSATIYGVCCYLIWRTCLRLRAHGGTVAILTIAYPAFFHLIAWGQTSAPALLCFTLAFLALRSRHEFLAGLALGLLAFKPPLALAAAVVFLFSAEWKVVAGALISATAQIAAAWAYYGTAVMHNYWNALRHLAEVFPYLEPRPYHMHSLRTFWSLLFPWPGPSLAAYVLTATAVLIVTTMMWRRRDLPLTLRFPALLIATVLVAPHLTVYDLVMLAPAFLLLTDWTMDHPANPLSSSLRMLLYLGYALPLVGPLAQWTHLQLSVLCFCGLLYCVWKITATAELLSIAN